MENTEKNYLEETKNILLSILQYCEKNDLKMWIEGSHNFKFFIGSKDNFDAQKLLRQYDPFESKYFSEVTEGMIYGSKFDIFLESHGKNSVIKPYAIWVKEDPKKYNEFYLNFFWENGKEATNIISKNWINNYFNLNDLINYTTENYPKGFSDNNIWWYDSGKNWRHFLDTIPLKNLKKFWENHDNFKEFHSIIKQYDSEVRKHSFLNYLTDKLVESNLSQDAMLRTSYMIMDVFSEQRQHYYKEKFPIISSLIAKNRKGSLFPQIDDEIIERAIFPMYHIFEYFNSDKFTATQYSDLTCEALLILKRNPHLQEKGLISADVTGTDDITFYMVLKSNEFINKHTIKNLYINIMNAFVSSPNAIIEANANRLKDKCDLNLLEQITKVVVDNFILDIDLPQKEADDKQIKKLKKI